MDLIVLLRTAEAVVWALVSATPHRTVEGRKLALVTKTGAGEGRPRLSGRWRSGGTSRRSRFNVDRGRVDRGRVDRGQAVAKATPRRRMVRRDADCGIKYQFGGRRISVSGGRVAWLWLGQCIGEQSIRVRAYPWTGCRTVKDDRAEPVRLSSGKLENHVTLPVSSGLPPHGSLESAGSHIPPAAHALHRAVGRT